MSMFCFQCEQTIKNKGCGISGACGKSDKVANLQDELIGELIGLSRSLGSNKPTEKMNKIVIESLFTTITNVNFNEQTLIEQIELVKQIKKETTKNCCENLPNCPNVASYDMNNLWNDNEDIRSLKSLILFGLKGMAAYAHHAYILGFSDEIVNQFFYDGLFYLGENVSVDRLFDMTMKLGEINLKCMELLDKANTQTYGDPVPTKVSCNIEPGPFIVVSGHDLHDLKLLLEQTENKKINIYTHGEMLPAHGYPELKRYSHLKGNFGTAWQNQQKEFANIPAPILFTTNCLMPIKQSYADRVFTTSIVSYPEIRHVDENKDFSEIINKSLELGGYKKEHQMTGINGGNILTTGFAHKTVLSVADKVVEGIKSEKIKHFFLVGGCDGAKMERNYYTEFVKQTPNDSIILTLACGKYRFNDLDLGDIEGLPRILDMGQCNDAYSAIKVATTLANVFECSVNELPLSLVLSWYEQKAVAILLTLLHLKIKNIYIGPTLPQFLSSNVLNSLIEKFNISLITTPKEDLAKMLKQSN